ncbi:RNA polymerase sigma factor [Calidifontibacillus oryziterrae]|uniref:RNA polymerase sigma factor n=1 Tax=Calidifontibacillus oryziterrae TaxID=1191699 RepID=UPI0002DBB541|nr:RNA polymerase sigma factor [Calidifontibacillus oryziterrae]
MFPQGIHNNLTNDDQSKRVIYEMFYSHVYKTAYFITRDPHAAQDILQETFIKIFRNMDKIEDGEKLKSWISTIASRTAIDYLRKQKRGNEFQIENVGDFKSDSNASHFTVEDQVEDSLICELVREEIDSLTPDYRSILYLKYIQDLKDQEIATILQLKVATVKTRIHRAKHQLKKRLQKNKTYIMA